MHKQKYLKENNVLISSCLQSEMMKNKFLLSKKTFLKSIILKRKILFSFCLQVHNITKKYIKLYKNICDLIIKNNFHLILKLHPTELNKKKITNYKKGENSLSILKKIKIKFM